jgi:SPX domain protein involved in polyphosphate accumulation
VSHNSFFYVFYFLTFTSSTRKGTRFSYGIEFNPENEVYDFLDKLLEKVYEFLLDHYKNRLGKIHLFNLNFSHETFAHPESEKRNELPISRATGI